MPQRKKSNPIWVFIQILGELVLTAGLVAMLYVAWQLYYTDFTADKAQTKIVKDISQEFKTAPAENSKDTSNDMSSFGDPIVPPVPAADGDKFGIVYIPRFGAEYARPLIQGTTIPILDTLGIGHYNETQMPGEVGNFAVAGHRNTNGSVLDLIGELQPGDHIYVQTKEGFYQYTYRNTIYVSPSQPDVLDEVPLSPKTKPTDRIMTLTSCHPRYTDHERVIAFAQFSGWRPADKGAPAEIAQAVAANQ
ncbi:MAG: class E sortase [Micrococcaceae bacterium]